MRKFTSFVRRTVSAVLETCWTAGVGGLLVWFEAGFSYDGPGFIEFGPSHI